jgi:hypothetical protein
MRHATPLMSTTPFRLDLKPLRGVASPFAGALAVSRVFRSLGIPALVEELLPLRKRQRGFSEAQMLECIVLLQTVGGDCPDDMKLIGYDQCLARGLGYELPKATAVREFLELFHDQSLETLRPAREVQRSFIFPSSEPLKALQKLQAATVQRISDWYDKQGQGQRIATIDMDATIIESHKATSYPHYEGGRGYQPMVALWAEADLVVADEFRDGNVPAAQEPLSCAQVAFSTLPSGVKERYFRGDSACHENHLLGWLSSARRAEEPGGRIGFAISAMMSPALRRAVESVKEKEWKTFATEADGTRRQWAEVDFVPENPSEHKDSLPLRYLGLRLLQAQGALFADGSDRHYHALVTNLDWDGAKLFDWHRQKAGTIEHLHDEIKNGLGGGHMPSQRFGVNAAWLRMAFYTYNILSAIKGLCLNAEERTARMKRLRLLLVNLAGQISRRNSEVKLRFSTSADSIRRIEKVWEVFPLVNKVTRIQPWGPRSA